MTQKIINIGQTPNDRSGDPLRTAFSKINDNFTEVYAALGTGGGGNPFDQDLNTTDAVSFASVGFPNGTTQYTAYQGENLEIDGGYASTTYTAELTIDGGGA